MRLEWIFDNAYVIFVSFESKSACTTLAKSTKNEFSSGANFDQFKQQI